MADEITRYTTAHQELNEAQEPHSGSLPPSPHKDQSKASSIHSTSPDSVDTGPLSPSSSNLESRYDPGVFTEANGDIAIRTEEEFEHVWKQVEDLRPPSVPGTPSGTNSAFSSCHSLAYSDDKIKVPFQREGGGKKIAHFAAVAGAHTSLKRPPWNGGARPNTTKMMKGLLQGSGVQEQDGPLAGKPVNSRAGLTGLLMMKKKVSRWRANRLQSWALGGTSRANTKTVALENTYQMEPTDSHKFLPEVVERVAEKSIRRTLTPNKTYDPKQAALLTRLITEDIKASVKALNYKRYKFVVQVFLGQDMSQGVQLSSRCVWDTALDGQATAVVKSKDIFCVANIFATYFE